MFPKVFELIQNNMDKILSGHDRSDGGLITSLIGLSKPNIIKMVVLYML